MDLKTLPPIDAGALFQIHGAVGEGSVLPKNWWKKLPLLRMDEFLGEEGFADLSLLYWSGGLVIGVLVQKPFEDCFFPEVSKGDGLEIFIDTRGIEDAQTVHKFCHHFVFLPKEKDGIIGAEVTRFRSEDKHELCDHTELQVQTTFSKKGYEMQIVIPENCLFGFDPLEYPQFRLGYIIHRTGGHPMHFPHSGDDYRLSAIPSLWAKLSCEGK